MLVKQSVYQIFNGTYQSNTSDNFNQVEYDLTKDSDIRRFIEDKAMNITSSIIFENNHRHTKNFISADHMVLDFDDGFKLDIILDEISKIQDLTTITIPSKSHQIEKDGKIQDRFHIVIFFNRTITSLDEYETITRYFTKELKQVGIDKNVKDGARMIFPSFNSGESMSEKVSKSIENEIEFNIYDKNEILLSKAGLLNVDNIIKIENERQLNDSKTIDNKVYENIISEENDKSIQNVLEYLKTVTITDHDDRLSITGSLQSYYQDIEKTKQVILNTFGNTDGNRRNINSIRTYYNEGNLKYTIGSLFYIAQKYGYQKPSKKSNDIEINMEYLKQLENSKIEKLEEIDNEISKLELGTLPKKEKLQKELELENKKELIETEYKIEVEKIENKINQDDLVKRNKYKTNIKLDTTVKTIGECNYLEFFNSFCGITVDDEVVIQFTYGINILPKAKASSYFSFFKLILADEKDPNKTKTYKLFDLWYEHSDAKRLRKDGVVFLPNYTPKYDEINEYDKDNIFAIKPVKYTDRIEIYKEYLYKILSNKDDYRYEYNRLMLDGIFQEIPLPINPTFVGEQGIGKSTLGESIILKAFNEKYRIKTSDASQIYGDKNGVIENKLFILLDEADIRPYTDRRKDYATSDEIGCRTMYKQMKMIKRLFNTITILNANDSKKIQDSYSASNRRDYYIEPNNDYREVIKDENGNDVKNTLNLEFYSKFHALLKDPTFIGEIIYFHQENKFNLESFRKMTIPGSDVKDEEAIKHMDMIDQWLFQLYDNDGEIKVDDITINLFQHVYQTSKMFDSFVQFCQKKGVKDSRNVISFGVQLGKKVKLVEKQTKLNGENKKLKQLDYNSVKAYLTRCKYIKD